MEVLGVSIPGNALADIPGKRPSATHSMLFSYNYAAADQVPPLIRLPMDVTAPMAVAASQVPAVVPAVAAALPPGTHPPPQSTSLVRILIHNRPYTKAQKNSRTTAQRT